MSHRKRDTGCLWAVCACKREGEGLGIAGRGPWGNGMGLPGQKVAEGHHRWLRVLFYPRGWGLCRVVPLWASVSPSVKWGLFFSGETGGWPSI